MNRDSTSTRRRHVMCKGWALLVPVALSALIATGCRIAPPASVVTGSEVGPQRTYKLRYLDFARSDMFLGALALEKVAYTSTAEGKIVSLWGTPAQVARAVAVLNVVDSAQSYCIENLGPASMMSTLPASTRIAAALGGITLGTFSEPPVTAQGPGAIIDVQGDAILAFIPVRYRDSLHRLLAKSDAGDAVAGLRRPGQNWPGERIPDHPGRVSPLTSQSGATDRQVQSSHEIVVGGVGQERLRDISATGTSAPAQPTTVLMLTEMAGPSDSDAKDTTPEQKADEAHDTGAPPKTVTIVLKPTSKPGAGAEMTNTVTDKATPENGEDLLDLSLPETVTVIQLLDLVGRHLGLNYVYDPRDIPATQSVALKLHGNLQGEMKVKNLYALLETVLGFMNLAMIRQQDSLVAIVPMDKALQTQPELVSAENGIVQVGDTVVTRAFTIRYVDITSVTTLLQNMKLSAAATSLAGSNVLLVTCHAGRMSRIEQLVEMIDCPGRTNECRLRRLYHVAATPLVAKIRAVLQQLQGIEVTTAATPAPAAQPATFPTKPAEPVSKSTVYLDADERANRLLMIGSPDELAQIEELIDALDVAREDVRIPKTYTVEHLSAQQAFEQLEKLDILKTSKAVAPAPDKGAGGNELTWEPVVVVVTATNQLLVRATPDQHADIQEGLRYIDVIPEDTRTIAAYEIQHIEAAKAKKMLEELDLVAVNTTISSFIPGPNQPGAPAKGEVPAPNAAEPGTYGPSVVVNESTNALLVKGTSEQHARIARIIRYVDTRMPANESVYQMYPLESSAPDHLAGLLERLVLETTKDKDGKIEKVATTPERIRIVPDPNTFSVIVYANPKDQKWIADLIRQLDKRRPQVLIDVTLVEISRTDTFEYDLNLVASANNPVTGNVVLDAIQRADSGSRIEAGFNPLDQNGNPTGRTKVFYSDENMQALLTAIQRKNYGRVLAKPKVLVDDGQAGQITTKDETTYVKESIQIPQTGTPITTRDFVSIDASIQLEITPHISEGDLLRLDVSLSRSDFGTRPLSGAPPDRTTSEVNTTVFVPHDHTVILGGLVRLNQTKGGSKVPFLGDIPWFGVLFRSIDDSDVERKLYVFLKANIVRPYDEAKLTDLQKISEEHEKAFEESESEFQKLESIPGMVPTPMPPTSVLRDYK